MTALDPVASGSPDRTGECCAGRSTPSAHEMTTGRVFYRKINPIKGQIVIYRGGLGRTRAGAPFVLPSLAARASLLGNLRLDIRRVFPTEGYPNADAEADSFVRVEAFGGYYVDLRFTSGRQGKFGRMSRTAKLETDPYRLLGVRPGASAEEVRRAFCRQAMLHHPDRNPGDTAAEKRFREILNAYEMARRVVEQRAGQSSPGVDPPKARRTRPHGVSAQRYARRSSSSGARFLKIVVLIVAFSIISITPLLTYIWFTTKTDWLPGCC